MGLLYLAHFTLAGLYYGAQFLMVETSAMMLEKTDDLIKQAASGIPGIGNGPGSGNAN